MNYKIQAQLLHLVEPSPWPLTISLGLGIMIIGGIIIFLGLGIGLFLLMISFLFIMSLIIKKKKIYQLIEKVEVNIQLNILNIFNKNKYITYLICFFVCNYILIKTGNIIQCMDGIDGPLTPDSSHNGDDDLEIDLNIQNLESETERGINEEDNNNILDSIAERIIDDSRESLSYTIEEFMDIPIHIDTSVRGVSNFTLSIVSGAGVGMGIYSGVRAAVSGYNLMRPRPSALIGAGMAIVGGISGGLIMLASRQWSNGSINNGRITIGRSSRNNSIGSDSDNSNSEGGPLRSVLEFDIQDYIDEPIVVTLFVIVTLLIISIQLLNFIILRLMFIKFYDKIEIRLKNYPRISKYSLKMKNIFLKVSTIYYIIGIIIIYINILSSIYFIIKILNEIVKI